MSPNINWPLIDVFGGALVVTLGVLLWPLIKQLWHRRKSNPKWDGLRTMEQRKEEVAEVLR